MFIYLGQMEDESTRASEETLKAISKKLAEALKTEKDKTYK